MMMMMMMMMVMTAIVFAYHCDYDDNAHDKGVDVHDGLHSG